MERTDCDARTMETDKWWYVMSKIERRIEKEREVCYEIEWAGKRVRETDGRGKGERCRVQGEVIVGLS